MLFVAFKASACSHSQPGLSMSQDDIIEFGSNILLVKAYRETASKPLKLQIEEILNGESQNLDKMLDKYRDYEKLPAVFFNEDFNGHKDKRFWHTDYGRSPKFGGSCWPAHVFQEGKTYLIFPDLQAALKSAEQINSPDDLWYQYVKHRIKELAEFTIMVHVTKSEETSLKF